MSILWQWQYIIWAKFTFENTTDNYREKKHKSGYFVLANFLF